MSKDDNYTNVLLEEIRGQNKLMVEAVGQLQDTVKTLATKENLARVETKVDESKYHLPDVLRTECYQAIIQISKELRISKEYLGNGLPVLNAA